MAHKRFLREIPAVCSPHGADPRLENAISHVCLYIFSLGPVSHCSVLWEWVLGAFPHCQALLRALRATKGTA